MVPKNVYKSPLNHGFWGLRFQDIMVHKLHAALTHGDGVHECSQWFIYDLYMQKKHEFWWITQWQNMASECQLFASIRLQIQGIYELRIYGYLRLTFDCFMIASNPVGWCWLWPSSHISLPDSEHQRLTSRQETESEIMTTFPTRVFRTESCRQAKTRSSRKVGWFLQFCGYLGDQWGPVNFLEPKTLVFNTTDSFRSNISNCYWMIVSRLAAIRNRNFRINDGSTVVHSKWFIYHSWDFTPAKKIQVITVWT